MIDANRWIYDANMYDGKNGLHRRRSSSSSQTEKRCTSNDAGGVRHSRTVGVAVALQDLLVVVFPLFLGHRSQDRQGGVPGGLERLPALPGDQRSEGAGRFFFDEIDQLQSAKYTNNIPGIRKTRTKKKRKSQTNKQRNTHKKKSSSGDITGVLQMVGGEGFTFDFPFGNALRTSSQAAVVRKNLSINRHGTRAVTAMVEYQQAAEAMQKSLVAGSGFLLPSVLL